MEAKNPRDNAPREVVADLIAAKAQALDEAALVWLLQRTVAALLCPCTRGRGPQGKSGAM